MRLIAPDILAEARGLSPGLLAAFLVVGGLLWLFGWYWHRFWVAAAITAGAGLVGLYSGQVLNTQILIVGLLLAIAAGLLAMELARIFSFLGVGVLAAVGQHAVLPESQPLIGFLAGGLLGIAIYRFWAMLLASFVGAMLVAHAALLLADSQGRITAATFSEQKGQWLNGVVIAATVLGMFAQRWAESYIKNRPARKKEKVLGGLSQAERDHLKKMAPPAPKKKPGLWGRLTGRAA